MEGFPPFRRVNPASVEIQDSTVTVLTGLQASSLFGNSEVSRATDWQSLE